MTSTLAGEQARVDITARGPLSDALLRVLAGESSHPPNELAELADAAAACENATTDDDLQLSLFVLYAISYGSLDQRGAEWEWDPHLIVARTTLEHAVEAQLRARVEPPPPPAPEREAVAATLFELTKPTPGPSLSRFVARRATLEQARELLMQRSIYTSRSRAATWPVRSPRTNRNCCPTSSSGPPRA